MSIHKLIWFGWKWLWVLNFSFPALVYIFEKWTLEIRFIIWGLRRGSSEKIMYLMCTILLDHLQYKLLYPLKRNKNKASLELTWTLVSYWRGASSQLHRYLLQSRLAHYSFYTENLLMMACSWTALQYFSWFSFSFPLYFASVIPKSAKQYSMWFFFIVSMK